MRRSVVLVCLVAFVACSKQGVTPPPAPQTSPKTSTKTSTLLDHVPDDTPFVLSTTGSSFTGAQLHEMIEDMRKEIEPALAMASDDMIASMEPNERIIFVALRAVMALDADAMDRLGLDPRRVEFAAYGWGLTPVLRLRLDGKFLRDLVDRAMKDAGLADPALQWGAHEYRVWTFGNGVQLVVVVLDDQLVMALSRRAEKILPHLVVDDAGRPARAFELATIAARYPQLEGTPVLFIDPARTAALVEKGDELRALLPDPPPGCAKALAGLARRFPAIAATTSEPARNLRTSRFVVGPSPSLAKALATGARPIPRWPGDAAEGEAIYGIGLSPLPVLEASADYIDDATAAVGVCGGEPPTSSIRDAIRMGAPLLAPVNGATFVIHEIAETEDMPLQVEIFADVADPYALYAWLASQLGLTKRPPALGTPTELNLGFLPATIVLESRAIAAAIGRYDAAKLEALRRAPAGPRAIMRISMGPGVTDNNPHGTTQLDAVLDGDTLVFDMVERAR
jgi:hypothetical protein